LTQSQSAREIYLDDVDVEWQVPFADHGWQEKYPNLKTYSDRLEERGSFKETVPKP
jgi:glutathione S-transferase